MSTKTVKQPGKKPYFSPAMESEIARRYFDEDATAEALAKEFGPLSPKGKIGRSTIRLIANRARKKQSTPAVEATGVSDETKPATHVLRDEDTPAA